MLELLGRTLGVVICILARLWIAAEVGMALRTLPSDEAAADVTFREADLPF